MKEFRSKYIDELEGTQYEEYSVQTTEEERYIEFEKMLNEYEVEVPTHNYERIDYGNNSQRT